MKVLLLASLLFATVSAQASDKGNGGDNCEKRIIEIRDDIKNWIMLGGSKNFDFPQNTTKEMYDESMIFALNDGLVSCTEDKLFVGKVEKTCKNFPESKEIVCNFSRFLSSNEEDQYQLIHHEYAGLADLEVNVTEESNYVFSKQVGALLEDVVVKKLALNPFPSEKTFEVKDTIIIQTYVSNFIPWKPKTETYPHLYQGDALTFCKYKGYHRVAQVEEVELEISDISYLKLRKYKAEDPRFRKDNLSIVRLKKRIDGTFELIFAQEKLNSHKAYTKIECLKD